MHMCRLDPDPAVDPNQPLNAYLLLFCSSFFFPLSCRYVVSFALSLQKGQACVLEISAPHLEHLTTSDGIVNVDVAEKSWVVVFFWRSSRRGLVSVSNRGAG